MALRNPFVATSAGVACLLAGSLLQGMLVGRWMSTAELTKAAKVLDEMPESAGPWVCVQEGPVDAKAVRLLEAQGVLHRTYRHRRSGDTVSLALVVGPTGPVSAHTPEICYSSQAFDFEGPLERIALQRGAGPPAEFWARTFVSLAPGAPRLRVLYGWNAGGRWVAPRHPRWELRAAPLLWKIQVAAPIPPQLDVRRLDPAHDFLQAFLPDFEGLMEPRRPQGESD